MDKKIKPEMRPIIEAFDGVLALHNRCLQRGGIVDSVREMEAIISHLGTLRHHIESVSFVDVPQKEVDFGDPEELDLQSESK